MKLELGAPYYQTVNTSFVSTEKSTTYRAVLEDQPAPHHLVLVLDDENLQRMRAGLEFTPHLMQQVYMAQKGRVMAGQAEFTLPPGLKLNVVVLRDRGANMISDKLEVVQTEREQFQSEPLS